MAVTPTEITRPARTYRINPGKALAAAALCWIAFAATVWAVQSGHTAAIDQWGLLFWRGPDLHPAGSKKVVEAVRDVTGLGGTLLRNVFALVAVVALLFLRLRREAALLAGSVLLALLLNSSLKVLVGRERPQIVPHLMEAGGMSFPSGHSFGAAVVYISIALAFAPMSARRSVRAIIVASAIAISMIIAWSRVWLGVHWPSDVIAGWLGGAGWAFLATALLDRPARVAAKATAPSP